MAKILMSDIKSGSENVKKVFRLPMISRSSEFLKTLTLTNDEMIEILNLADGKEHQSDCRYFLQRLVLSQQGPFKSEMFGKFVNKLFDKESLIRLIENSTGLTMENKIEFIKYSVLSAPFHFIPNFYMKGEHNKYGIDITKSPLNREYVCAHIRIDINNKMHITPEYLAFLFKILDTLTDDEIFDWYKKELNHKIFKVRIISSYENCPVSLLLRIFDSFNKEDQHTLAKHPKFPDERKMEIFEETKDPAFLPQHVQDIFVF